LIHSMAASRKSRAAFIKQAKFSRSGFIVNADSGVGDAATRARVGAIAVSGRPVRGFSSVAGADAVSA
jgi:hypothetical protein